MEEQFRPKERVGGSSPSRGTPSLTVNPRQIGGYRIGESGRVTAYLKPTCEWTKPSLR
jgi:hypothetical protein